MRKKQWIALLLLGCFLVGLAAGYWGYSFYIKNKIAKEAEEQNQRISILQTDRENIKSISYTYLEEDINLVKNSEGWVNESDGALIDQEDIEAMLGAASDIAAKRVILEEAGDDALLRFGLLNPQVTYTINMNDGSTFKVVIGAKMISEEDSYYALLGNEKKAYSIASDYVEPFEKSEIEIRQIEDELDFATEDIRLFEVESENTSFAATYVGSEEGENTYYTWKIDRPYTDIMADTDSLNEILAEAVGLEYRYCVKKSAGSLEEYGLEEPRAIIMLGSDSNEVQIDIGDEHTFNETRYYYVRPDYSDNVYLMDADSLDKITGFDEFSLVDPCIYSVLVKDVKSFDITCDGKTYKITKKEVPRTKDDNSKGDSKTGSEYYVNGKKVVDEDILTIYSLAYLLTLSGEAEDEMGEGECVLSFIYRPNKGEEVTVKYNTYDGDNFYRVDKNGMDNFLTDKRGVDEIITSVKDFARKYDL